MPEAAVAEYDSLSTNQEIRVTSDLGVHLEFDACSAKQLFHRKI
jgi:hypothetical protein